MPWHRRQRLITGAFAGATLLLTGLIGLTAHFAVTNVESERARLAAEERGAALGGLLAALIDAQTAVRGYALVGDLAYLEPYYRSLEASAGLTKRLDATLDAAHRWHAGGLKQLAEQQQKQTAAVLRAMQAGSLDAGRAMIREGTGEQLMDRIRRGFGEAIAEARDDAVRHSEAVRGSTRWLAASVSSAVLAALALGIVQFGLFRAEIARRGRSEAQLEAKNADIRLLSELANALQAANMREESYTVIESLAGRLLSGTPGALYIYSQARDHLQLAASWEGAMSLGSLPVSFAPEACWALRRGVPLIGRIGASTVNCAHVARGDHSYLCMPIQGQGVVYGLLHLLSPSLDEQSAFRGVEEIARGLAEQLSLALANIELRERLRSLAIRDSLTGLYNRRFLEEVLERELSRADRSGTKVSVALLDIDHFKSFNDSFGHGIGDEVLKRIAGFLTAAVRRTDIVCRFGGEELVLVLPDCDAERALSICEKLREGVARLDLSDTRADLPHLTVSIGVTVYPDICAEKDDVVHSADRAMYRAKHGGRNRVCLAAVGGEAAGEARQGNVVRVGEARGG